VGNSSSLVGSRRRNSLSLLLPFFFGGFSARVCTRARANHIDLLPTWLTGNQRARARVVMQCSACTHLRYTHMCARARNRLSNSYVFSTFYLLHMYLMKNKNVLKRNSCPLSRNTHTEATPPNSFCAKISPLLPQPPLFPNWITREGMVGKVKLFFSQLPVVMVEWQTIISHKYYKNTHFCPPFTVLTWQLAKEAKKSIYHVCIFSNKTKVQKNGALDAKVDTQKNYTKIEANFSVDGCLLACEKLTTITN